ncbi:MAG: HD domain-containing protein [Phycisphaerae bacterium]
MNKQEIARLAREAMGQRLSHRSRPAGYIFQHGLRVARLSAQLADCVDPQRQIDRDTLWAGALLHDVGKGIDPHHEIGGVVAGQLLADLARADQIEIISRIIAEHNQRYRAQHCLPASRIVQDADMLDHHGHQGVCLILGEVPSRFDTLAHAAESQLSPDGAEHFQICRSLLNFDVAREAFDRRIEAQKSFFQGLAASEEGQL